MESKPNKPDDPPVKTTDIAGGVTDSQRTKDTLIERIQADKTKAALAEQNWGPHWYDGNMSIKDLQDIASGQTLGQTPSGN